MVHLMVALGGALGASMRYWVSQRVQGGLAGVFPVGILTVNVLGTFVLGVVYGLAARGLREEAQVFVGAGFCGAFTTFSTFSINTLDLLRQGAVGYAVANVLTNVLLCLVSAWLGLQLMRQG